MNNPTFAPERHAVAAGEAIAAAIPEATCPALSGLVAVLRVTGYLSAFELHGGDPAGNSSHSLDILRRLFIAGSVVSREEADLALPDLLLRELIPAGFLAEDTTGIRSLFH